MDKHIPYKHDYMHPNNSVYISVKMHNVQNTRPKYLFDISKQISEWKKKNIKVSLVSYED